MYKKMNTDAVDHVFDAILCLNTREDCYNFFEDLCTINELVSLSQRLEVARMLKDGKTFMEITKKTGVSTATISRVNNCLKKKDNCGYEMVLARLKKEN